MQKNVIKKQKKIRLKRKIKIVFLCALLLFTAVFIYYLKVVCPIVTSLSKEKILSIATSSVSEVVGEVLLEQRTTYDDLVEISYSQAGEVEIIEVNSVQVNLLIREVTKKVQERFNKLNTSGIDVALGTFTGIPFLYGIGPSISVQLVPVGTIKTKLDSQFKSAGINQTLHRLNFVVCANIGMVLPINTQNLTTELEVMICESVIVGKIPNVYLQGNLI